MVEHNLAKVGVAGSTPVSRSIFILFLLSLLFINSFAKEIELKSHYTLDSSCITLKTLEIDDANTSCIFKLSDSRTSWRVPVYKIINRLNKIDISVKHPHFSIISFEKETKIDLSLLKDEIKRLYREKYPSIDIKNISIFPTTHNIDNFIYDPSNCYIKLSNSMLKRDRGTFSVKCNKLNYFFKYFISATLDVYKANHQIKKDRIIDSNAFRKERIAFKTIYSFPLYNLKDKSLMAKQTIAKDKILTSAMVVPVPDVRRKETVNCFIQDGSVHIEFSATALQNGYIGDEITLKREDGKALRGVVVRKNLVKIK